MPLTVPDIHAITARRVHNLPDSWCPRIYEYLDRERKFALTGAVPIGTYSRGPRKGLPKWPPLRDLQRVVITMDEMRQTQIQWEHETGKGGTTDEITLRVIRSAELLQQRHAEPVPGAFEVTNEQRNAARAAVAKAIGDGAYDCFRVWEAWNVGTMGQDDFEPIVEDDSRIAEIADAAIDELMALKRQQRHPEPVPEPPAEALAARPLLEKVARLGDVIGRQTVAQVQQLAEQAAVWLRDNPPGQPVAIEPRGCPTPGACTCVEPALPLPTGKEPTRLRNCPTHGQQPPWAWGCPECVRQLREELAALQQRHPEPVPISERLPGPEDCTTNPRNGRGQWCWGWVQHDQPPYSGRWRMMLREWLSDEAVAWLPATALPLPQQETPND